MPKKRKAQTRQKMQTTKAKPKVTRRNLLQNVILYGIGGVAVTGFGYWGLTSFQGAMGEQDLSVLGAGQPAIVQVHDRNCEICTALQTEVRAALSTLEDQDLKYRVAYLDSTQGMEFATQHGASFATLLFFDGDGNMTRKLQGASDRNTLRAAFLSHLATE